MSITNDDLDGTGTLGGFVQDCSAWFGYVQDSAGRFGEQRGEAAVGSEGVEGLLVATQHDGVQLVHAGYEDSGRIGGGGLEGDAGLSLATAGEALLGPATRFVPTVDLAAVGGRGDDLAVEGDAEAVAAEADQEEAEAA